MVMRSKPSPRVPMVARPSEMLVLGAGDTGEKCQIESERCLEACMPHKSDVLVVPIVTQHSEMLVPHNYDVPGYHHHTLQIQHQSMTHGTLELRLTGGALRYTCTFVPGGTILFHRASLINR